MNNELTSAAINQPTSQAAPPQLPSDTNDSGSAGASSIDAKLAALTLDSNIVEPSSDLASVSSVPPSSSSGIPSHPTPNTTTAPTTAGRMNYITLAGSASLSDISSTLESNGVPTISLVDACAGCAHSDDCNGDGHEEHEEFELGSYPNKFDIDFESQLGGTTKPYGRQVSAR